MTVKRLNKVLVLALAIALVVSLLPVQAYAGAAIHFTDVSQTEWYYNDVHTLANKGVVSGIGNNKFNPEGNVAYCEMIKMVVNAFFRDKFAEYEAEEPGLWAYFGTQVYWYSFMAKYASDVGLLEGIDVDIRSYSDSYRPMTRYDMARILANTALTKGIEPTAEQLAAAQANILDYASIPDDCKNAVVTCFALTTKNASGQTVSLLNGHNGYFKGSDNMTRAEACAVIIRLDNLITNGNGGTVVDPDPTPTTPDEPVVKDVAVSKNVAGAWMVTDNENPDGYLNNGKPITEENVVELLNKAETIWTKGMTWAHSGTANNNSYGNPSDIMYNMMSTNNTGASANNSVNFACGGYAAIISDYIFGKQSNNFHRVANISDIRPGDVIVEIKNGAVYHAFVAVSVPGGTYNQGTTTHDGYIHITDGNNGGKVNWPDKYTAPLTQFASQGTTWQIYSRYPA